jgi:hypothetical protein
LLSVFNVNDDLENPLAFQAGSNKGASQAGIGGMGNNRHM